jgi:hypothetical protein
MSDGYMTYMSLFFKALFANIPHLEFFFRGDGRCKLIIFPDACQSALHCVDWGSSS